MAIEKIASITIRLKPHTSHDAYTSGWHVGLQRGIAEGLRQAAVHCREKFDNEDLAAAGELDAEAERIDAGVWGE